MPRISTIVPAYNAEKDLNRCLNSILAQTMHDFEIIIINDGSTDATLKICEEYANRDVRVIIKSQTNQGVSAARNYGLSLASGEYICFIDADDYIDSRYFEVLLRNITEQNADISVCGWSRSEQHEKDIPSVQVWNQKESFYQLFKYDVIDGSVCCKLYRKDAIQNIRFNNELKLGEDQIFFIQAIEQSKKMVFQDLKLYMYAYNPNSAMNTAIDKRYWDAVTRAEWLKNEAKKLDEDLVGLFYKEEISIYLFLIIIGYKSNSKVSREISDYVIPRIKVSSTSTIRKYSTTKSFVQYILIKYFSPVAAVLVRLKNKLA